MAVNALFTALGLTEAHGICPKGQSLFSRDQSCGNLNSVHRSAMKHHWAAVSRPHTSARRYPTGSKQLRMPKHQATSIF